MERNALNSRRRGSECAVGGLSDFRVDGLLDALKLNVARDALVEKPLAEAHDGVASGIAGDLLRAAVAALIV